MQAIKNAAAVLSAEQRFSSLARSSTAMAPGQKGQVNVMKSKFILLVICFLALCTAGCIKVQKFHPAPISPAASASQLEARTLDNPALEKFLETNLGRKLNPWPPKSWDLRMLSLAAIYYSPAMEQARAEVSAANAAVETAGERPNPTFRIQPGIPSPYLFALSFLFPIRTAGKRRLMVEQAKDLTMAARLNLAQAAWQVFSNVRTAMVNYLLARREVGLLQLQQGLQTRRVALLRQRLAAGEISQPMVASARLSMLQTKVAIETAQGRVPETRAALAAAVGVPVAAMADAEIAWPGFEQPPKTAAFPAQTIQRDAVLNRLDVRRALAEYAATQAALQLEIARQHPDFQLGPGYDFEEGHNYFTLGYSVTLPVFNRNQGPIAQAEAQRKAAAAVFLATQANAIAASEEALARYRGAMRELNGTEQALRQLEHVVVPTERRTVSAGETDQLALNAVLLQRPALAATWLTALGRAQSALGSLEDAVERPLGPDEIVLPGPAELHDPEKRMP
jgi:outer membrane protein, heavy metal efflux system